MKNKWLVTSALAALLLSGGVAQAEGDEGTVTTTESTESVVEEGATPDETLAYFFDRLGESLQLLITFDEQKEAELLLQQAQERLAEAEAMAAQGETEQVKELMTAYQAVLAEAVAKITESSADGEVDAEKQEALSKLLAESTGISEELAAQLDEEEQTELEEQQQEAVILARVVQGLDPVQVQAMHDQGLGYGQIAKIFALADLTGKTVDEVAGLVTSGEHGGFGKLAQELGVKPKDIAQKVKEHKKSLKNGETTEDGAAESEPATETETETPEGTESTDTATGSESTGTATTDPAAPTAPAAITGQQQAPKQQTKPAKDGTAQPSTPTQKPDKQQQPQQQDPANSGKKPEQAKPDQTTNQKTEQPKPEKQKTEKEKTEKEKPEKN